MIQIILSSLGLACTMAVLFAWYRAWIASMGLQKALKAHDDTVQRLTDNQRHLADRLAQLEAFKERMYGDFR